MTQAILGPDYDFIDLLSDNIDECTAEQELNPIEQQYERYLAQRPNTQPGGNAWNAIDLTDIPDIDVPPSEPGTLGIERHGSSSRDGGAGLITEAECSQMVLNILPAISVDYVLNLIREKTTNQTRTAAQCEQIVVQLLDGTHPTEADAENKRKRKRKDDDGIGRYGEGEWDHAIRYDTEA
jgi:TRIAD3 protein (E3 ubiquitin-protein ligase RNF216)